MRTGLLLADRTAVLFLGVAAGAAIGYAFAGGGDRPPPALASAPPLSRPAPAVGRPAGMPAKPDVALECALPFQPHLLDAVAAARPVTVGVFGDSFGDGVWSALYRLLPASERYHVVKYSQQSTGFTRYASLNLEEHARAQIAADGPIDVAVVSFGANDTQGVYADGHAAPLMSPEWQRVIGARVDGFVRLMRERGAIVYWLGLPKMRAAAFDADIAAMNAFYERRMQTLKVPFIDIRPLTMDAAGDYAPYLPDPVSNERRLMRANDGVHMSMNGYVVITRGLADRIKAYVDAARTTTGAVPPTPPPAPPVPAAEPSEPPTRRGEPARRPAEARPKPAPTPRPEPAGTDAEPPARPKPDLPPPARVKPETPPVPKPQPEAPSATKPRAEPSPAKPKADAAPPAKPRVEPTKPKADTPPSPAKPAGSESGPARPSAEPRRDAKPKPETKPGATKPETKPATRQETKPATKPAPDKAAPKPAPKPAPTLPPGPSERPPLRLNLPPPEDGGRKPAAPPPADQP